MPVTLEGAVTKGHRPLVLWPLEAADLRALVLLVLVPLAVFSIPTLAGHPVLVGDNLIQNYPLRVLTGEQLRAGHLPLWNPLAFSGTPLLGALNSGSYYPATFLFVVLPNMVAWVLNLVLCYVSAGVGIYLLARWLGLRSLASLLAALSYTYMGAMWGQLVHLGVIQGQGLLPWVVLSLLVLCERLRANGSSDLWRRDLERCGWPFVTLVLLTAAIVLTGEPRSIADFAVVGLIAGAYVLLAPSSRPSLGRRALLAVVSSVAVGWGVALCAAELLVSQHVIALSQRSDLSQSFIGSGSLKPVWTTLLAIPDLVGGSGLLHQPTWFIEYNLPEVTGYVGLLALAALLAAAGALIGARRRRAPSWLWLFVAMVVVGLILSWGAYTPAFDVIGHLPLLDRTRLQSRNLAVVDLGLVMLLAWFLDRLLSGDLKGASLTGWRRWLTVSPLLATVLLALIALARPFGLERWLAADASAAVEGHYLWPWIAVALALAVTGCALLLGAHRLGAARLRRLVVAFMLVDLTVFLLATTTSLISDNSVEPNRSVAVSTLGTAGRFALVDPTLGNFNQFVVLGTPNSNVFTGLPSIQGYGSLINGTYGAATDAHLLQELDGCQLALGRYRQLDLASMAVGASQLAPVIYQPTGSPRSTPAPAVEACKGAPAVPTSGGRRFYFGQSVAVSRIFLASKVPPARLAASEDSATIELLDAAGQAHAVASTVAPLGSGWSIHLEHPEAAAGLLVLGPAAEVTDSSTVTDSSAVVRSLDGGYQDALDAAAWRLSSTSASYQVFKATRPLVPAVRLIGGGATSKVLSRTLHDNSSETDVIDARAPLEVVRSEAYSTGWRVTYTAVSPSAATGGSRTVAVGAHDLVQSFRLPAGLWRVDVFYRPSGLMTGMEVSAVAAAALVVLVVALCILARRRSRTDRID
jgi:hypothetical protein